MASPATPAGATVFVVSVIVVPLTWESSRTHPWINLFVCVGGGGGGVNLVARGRIKKTFRGRGAARGAGGFPGGCGEEKKGAGNGMPGGVGGGGGFPTPPFFYIFFWGGGGPAAIGKF